MVVPTYAIQRLYDLMHLHLSRSEDALLHFVPKHHYCLHLAERTLVYRNVVCRCCRGYGGMVVTIDARGLAGRGWASAPSVGVNISKGGGSRFRDFSRRGGGRCLRISRGMRRWVGWAGGVYRRGAGRWPGGSSRFRWA
eukprot:5918266-Pyramimonas_sp.AAC.1